MACSPSLPSSSFSKAVGAPSSNETVPPKEKKLKLTQKVAKNTKQKEEEEEEEEEGGEGELNAIGPDSDESSDSEMEDLLAAIQ